MTTITNTQTNYSIDEFVKKFSFPKCVFDLLTFIEKDNKQVKNIIIRKYLKLDVSEAEEEETLNYFINHSVFSAATFANPATSVVTEFLYAKPKVLHPIDQYFFESKGGKAINSRVECVETHLHKLTEAYLKKGTVLIGNMGGGPGRDVVDVFSKYYKNNDNIFSINIDKDHGATLRGKRIATSLGVRDKIEFLETSFMRYKPKKKFDIIILVGVLCGLPPETCTLILKRMRKMLAKNGCIVASNVAPKMLKEDPFTYFIMSEITNWRLIFKEEELLKEVFKKAGLKWQKSFTDELGFHFMGIGAKKDITF